jgi:hypothetical protein
MRLLTHRLTLIIAVMLFTGIAANAQTNQSKTSTKAEMKTYVIEREIANAGKLTAAELKGISQTSCGVLKEMGPKIQWVHSYVTGNKIYCIYKAESEELIREHARKGGFPANKISEVANVISPATAN